MRVAVVGEPTGWHVQRLVAALAGRGHDATVVRWAELAARVTTGGDAVEPAPLAAADIVVVRGMPGSGDPTDRLEEVIFRMDVLGRLADRGTPVVNPPRALEASIDKYLALARLAAAGLPVPRTIVLQDPDGVARARDTLGGDCVVKPLFGSQGRGLRRLDSAAATAAWLAEATAAGRTTLVTYLQEFVPHGGWDARILLVGERAFTMRRLAPAGDWRTNISRGGRGEPFAAPAGWIPLARRAAAILGAEVAGVDILPGPDGHPMILEVNAVPGWRGLEAATGADVTTAVAAHLEQACV